MDTTKYSIAPDEVAELEKYIQQLQDDQFYSQELRLNKEEDKISILEIGRKLFQFHKDELLLSNDLIWFQNDTYSVDYLIETAKHNHSLKVLLHDQSNLISHLLNLYNKKLKLSPRHNVLSKSLAEMTGYDLYQVATFIFQDMLKDGKNNISPGL